MAIFRIMLVAIFLTVLAYTAVTVAHHGPNLFPAFFGDLAKMGWPGQFNLDFAFMLLLGGTWIAWRHGFTAAGLGLGLCVMALGSLFLSAYLLMASIRAKGDVRLLLTGPRA
jgi:hypothetical protein